jgi:hypothetical protein
MQQRTTNQLDYSDIGYKGKPIDTLTKEELLEAFLELAQKVYECASQDNPCKDVFLINAKG